MASRGIRDRVAIVGMGCTNFGEHWDRCDRRPAHRVHPRRPCPPPASSADDIDAYWLGTMGSGTSGLTLSKVLRLDNKPVTRLENMCATGSEALRNACYAVASGAFDMAMAVGVEKLKDSGFSGLVGTSLPGDGTLPETTAPARFSLLAPAYAKKYGVDDAEIEGRAHPHRVEEPLQRGPEPARPVPQGGFEGRHRQRRRPSPGCWESSTARAYPTVRPRPWW